MGFRVWGLGLICLGFRVCPQGWRVMVRARVLGLRLRVQRYHHCGPSGYRVSQTDVKMRLVFVPPPVVTRPSIKSYCDSRNMTGIYVDSYYWYSGGLSVRV